MNDSGLLSHQENCIRQHQLPILPKTPENGIVCKKDQLAITHILHANEQAILQFLHGLGACEPTNVIILLRTPTFHPWLLR